MKWPAALAITAMVFCGGCRYAQGPPATDPFFGRTRVVPPATGCIMPGPVNPYYGGATPSATTPSSSATPSSANPRYPAKAVPSKTEAPTPATTRDVPPSTYHRSGKQSRGTAPAQSAIRVPPPSFAKSNATAGVPDVSLPVVDDSVPAGRLSGGLSGRPRANRRTFTGSNVPLSERERVVRILPPRPKDVARPSRRATAVSAAKSIHPQPRPSRIVSRPIDIMDLPPVDKSKSAGAKHPTEKTPPRSDAGIRLISATGPVVALQEASNVIPAGGGAPKFAPRSDYSHNATYERLQGKLEYSQLDRRWKLRYIPVDGETDKYGGSVILSDPTVLRGCERGDFIEVEGRLGPQDSKRKGFAPEYHVSKVKRL